MLPTEKILEKSLRSGALGLSTGLVYTHAQSAPMDVIIELVQVVAKQKGTYSTHIRGEKEDIVEAVEEAMRIGEGGKAKVHISHLKVMGEKNWDKMTEVLEIIEHAKENGVDVTFDVYPYTNTGSVLYSLLPSWVAACGKRMMIQKLRNPVIRNKVVNEMREIKFDFDKIEVAISPLNKTLARRKIVDIAQSQEKTIEEAIIDILIASEGRVIVSMEVLNEKNVEKAIKHPLSIIATNGAGYNEKHARTGEMVHPRCFGACTKVLVEFVQNKKVLRMILACIRHTL